MMTYTPSRRPAALRGKGMTRRAVATVEFALVAPVFVAFVLGMLEMGRAFMVREALSNAARAGCRVGLLPNKDNAAIKADITNVLKDYKLDSSKATITIKVNDASVDAKTAKAGDRISVGISIPAADVTWTKSLFLSNQNIVSETLVMMRQA